MTDFEKTTPLNKTTILNTRVKVRGDEHEGLEPYLVILSGPDQGKQHRLTQQYNRFGRSTDVDLTIADFRVSRRHGVFIVFPDGVFLEDSQSTNGCYVDNVRIKRQKIEPMSRIRVGNTWMKVEYKKALEVESEQALYQAANSDALTGIPNRRAFMSAAEQEFASSVLTQQGLFTIVMCDVDHFKRINDNFGHPAGDQVLIDLAQILSTEMRKEDMLARYGGEEFIMLLRNTDLASAVNWAERIREKVQGFQFSFQNQFIPTTLSVGVCCRNWQSLITLEDIIQEADNALYRAKHNGRNRVETA